MTQFIVTLRRKTTIHEYATVLVSSSAAHYAEKEARATVGGESWCVISKETTFLEPTITRIDEVGQS